MALVAATEKRPASTHRHRFAHESENNNRGFWLGLPWQRKGLMSEAVEVITDYWFNELGFSVMRVPKAVVNTASRRISEKNGRRWHVQIEFLPTLLAA